MPNSRQRSDFLSEANHNRPLHLCNTYAGYAPFGFGCSPASPFQNILCFPFYMNFKTAAKIIFFIQPTLRCIGGLLLSIQRCRSFSTLYTGTITLAFGLFIFTLVTISYFIYHFKYFPFYEYTF